MEILFDGMHLSFYSGSSFLDRGFIRVAENRLRGRLPLRRVNVVLRFTALRIQRFQERFRGPRSTVFGKYFVTFVHALRRVRNVLKLWPQRLHPESLARNFTLLVAHSLRPGERLKYQRRIVAQKEGKKYLHYSRIYSGVAKKK